MDELRIIRGRDIGAAIDGTELCGLTELRATCKRKTRPVYEYLSSAPYALLPDQSSYEIRLDMMTMFGGQVPTDAPFTLSISDRTHEYIYEHCRVSRRYTEVKGSADAREVFLIEAQNMREQEIENE